MSSDPEPIHSRPFIIPLFIPHLGCPHRCVFCNQSSITGRDGTLVSPEEAGERIRTFLGYKKENRGPVEVAFYGGNFLGLSPAYRTLLLDVAHGFVERGEVDASRSEGYEGICLRTFVIDYKDQMYRFAVCDEIGYGTTGPGTVLLISGGDITEIMWWFRTLCTMIIDQIANEGR